RTGRFMVTPPSWVSGFIILYFFSPKHRGLSDSERRGIAKNKKYSRGKRKLSRLSLYSANGNALDEILLQEGIDNHHRQHAHNGNRHAHRGGGQVGRGDVAAGGSVFGQGVQV